MHSSYNYCGFVDLYRSLVQQRRSTSGSTSTTPAAGGASHSPAQCPARTRVPARQPLRLVSG